MKESDAREVIRWEAEQHVPFDIKSVELDFQILDPLEEGLQMQVLLVAVKRELVDNRVSLLLDAGLSPAALTWMLSPSTTPLRITTPVRCAASSLSSTLVTKPPT